MNYKNTIIDWPLDKNIIRRNDDNNTFGLVRRNVDGSPRPHQGWDFYAKAGTPCYAIADGKVEYVGNANALGLLIVVSIGATGKYAAYAHLSQATVKAGDRVLLGQLIGRTGNSGNAKDMKGEDEHLHFEIRDKPLTGLGLADRMSPIEVFGICPLNNPIARGGNYAT